MEPISNPNSKALVVYNPEIAVSRDKSRTTSSRKVSSSAKDPTQKNPRRSTRTSSRLAAKSPQSNPNPANHSPNPMRKRPRESDAPQFSEIRSKRRHQAFSQQPYLPDFIDANSKKRFDDLFSTKEFLVEQSFTIDSHSVFEILQLNQLENCVSFGGNYNKSAVAEFYANIGPAVTDTKSPTYQKVFVRGVWVNFSPTDINQLLGSPMELSDFSPELDRPNISPDELVQTLTKHKFQVWPENSSLFPASHLSTQFSLLHKLSKSQWIPSSHLSDISQREAMFLYLLASKTENLNIGCVIYENILERANPNKQRKLVHPVLITKLLKQQSVPFRPSDVVLDAPAPLGSNKRLHTGNRVNDLPSSSASRAETRQFYPAHLTAELRAAVSDAQKCLLRLSSILDEVSKNGLPSTP